MRRTSTAIPAHDGRDPRTRARVSAIVAPTHGRSPGRLVTAADLALIDAAIEMVRASRLPRDEAAGAVAIGDPASEQLVYVVPDATIVAEVCFQIFNSGLIGDVDPALRMASLLKVESQRSLDGLIDARNVLAEALQRSAEKA